MVPVALQDTKVVRPPAMRTLLRFLWWMIQTDPRLLHRPTSVLQFTTGLTAGRVGVDRAGSSSTAVSRCTKGRLPVADMLVWIAPWAVLVPSPIQVLGIWISSYPNPSSD